MSLPVLLLFEGRIFHHAVRVYQLPEQELTRVRHKSSIIGVSWRIGHSGRRPGIPISIWLHTSGFLVKPGMTRFLCSHKLSEARTMIGLLAFN